MLMNMMPEWVRLHKQEKKYNTSKICSAVFLTTTDQITDVYLVFYYLSVGETQNAMIVGGILAFSFVMQAVCAAKLGQPPSMVLARWRFARCCQSRSQSAICRLRSSSSCTASTGRSGCAIGQAG